MSPGRDEGAGRASTPTAIPGRAAVVDVSTSTVRLGSDSLDRLAQDITAIGTDGDVHAPAEVVQHLHAVARHLAAAREQ